MKLPFLLLIVLILYTVNFPQKTFAQSPEAFSYQAVLRDAGGALIRNTEVGMRIGILQGSPEGTEVYVEEYTVTTNANGLITLKIGSASQGGETKSVKSDNGYSSTLVGGDLSSIDWSDGPYFLKVETDPEGGTNYTITGVSQLLSVPYALHAKNASNVKFKDGDNRDDAVYNSGNVGIGTEAPEVKFEVKGTPAGLGANIRTFGDIHLGYGSTWGGGLFFGSDSYSWATGDYIRQTGVGKLEVLAAGTKGTRLLLDNSFQGAKIVNNGDAWLRIAADNDNSGGDDGTQNAYLQFTTDGGNDGYDGLIWLENLSGDTKLHFDVENQETMVISDGKIGVKKDTPEAELDVNGTLKLADGSSSSSPKAGMVRWNSTANDFEGFNGSDWVSLTKSNNGWGNITANETDGVTVYNNISDMYFGSSVSMDGDYAIAGAVGTSGGNVFQGSAYILSRNGTGTSWSIQKRLTAPDGAIHDNFGYSVSVSGDYAIVGAPYKKIGDNDNQGKVYIFHRDKTSWNLQAAITASDGEAGDWFGISVSIDGDYAVVGAELKNVQGNHYQGKAYIYHRSGTGWSLQGGLLAPDGISEDYFGAGVSISGDYIIVGASDVLNFGEASHTHQGKAYIFHHSGAYWVYQARLTAPGGEDSDNFGNRVSIDGHYAIVGASYKDAGENTYQGKSYIFYRDGTTWSRQAELIARDGKDYDFFGRAVSVSGDYAVVGNGAGRGKAYVFHRSGTEWSQQATLTPSDEYTDGGGAFGTSVSLYGDFVLVGASYKEVGGYENKGKVYFYKQH